MRNRQVIRFQTWIKNEYTLYHQLKSSQKNQNTHLYAHNGDTLNTNLSRICPQCHQQTNELQCAHNNKNVEEKNKTLPPKILESNEFNKEKFNKENVHIIYVYGT